MAVASTSAAGQDAVAAFQRSLIYQQTAPIERILEDLAAIRVLAKASEGLARRWRLAGIGAVVVGIALLAVGVALQGGGRGALIAVGALGLVAGIVLLFVIAPRAGHLDVEDRRYTLLGNVLGLERIQQDVGTAAVRVELDLRKATDQAKRTEVRQEGNDQFSTYLDRWLLLEADLHDRSHVRAAVVERTVVRRRTRRSSSGKTKTKTKTKARLAATLTIRRPRSAGSFDAETATQPALVELMPGVSVKDVAFKDRSATIKTVAPGEWSSQAAHGRLNATELLGKLYDAGREVASRSKAG
jgi:hypothetical protein